jgi:hypothetical protein
MGDQQSQGSIALQNGLDFLANQATQSAAGNLDAGYQQVSPGHYGQDDVTQTGNWRQPVFGTLAGAYSGSQKGAAQGAATAGPEGAVAGGLMGGFSGGIGGLLGLGGI